MGKLLGSRIVSKQKTCHLICNMGMVHCTHNFVNINLASSASHVELQEQVGESLLDYRFLFIYQLYSYRNNESYYDPAYPRLYWVQYFEQKQITIESMCLTDFCKTFTVGRGRQNSNKLLHIAIIVEWYLYSFLVGFRTLMLHQ